jgi:signal transduction histidine kinase
MDALRRFAARVAHNFNNLLTPVTGYADLLLHSLPTSDPNRQDIEAIQKSGSRAAFLARQLLIFAGRQVTKPRETGLNALIRSLEEPVRAALGSDVRLLCELDPQVPQLKLDPAQFEQLLVNLAQNAREAMPEGGLFSISTSFVTRGYALTPPSPLPDPSVLIKIADTGVGMDEDTQRQAFEPFFSAREPGKGLGLGLAAVYGIVRQLGGAIRVMSRPGQGSTFLIYLPVAHPSEGVPPGGRFSVRELSKTPR